MKDKILEFVKCRLSVAGVSFAATAHKDLFKDHELETFLSFAVTTFNAYPPFTNITLDGPHAAMMAPYVAQLTVAYALAAKALPERGREFTQSDNGIYFDPPNISDLLDRQCERELYNFHQVIKQVKLDIYNLTMVG